MASNKSLQDGVINPAGFGMGLFVFAYVACYPVVSYLSGPGGIAESIINTVIGIAVPSTLKGREIAALAAIYLFAVYPATGAFSVAGQASARKAFDNNHPRVHLSQLRGLPLRLHSAHNNLMETFPTFAVAAALAQLLAPNNQQIINLLGLHVLLKVFVFYPSYLLNISALRSVSHLLSLTSAFAVVWKIARGA